MHQSHVIHLSINRSFADAYDFLAEPRNYPRWAAVVESTFRQIGPNEWTAQTEFGERIIRFCERNELGVLDHAVYRYGDQPLMMPMRLIPNDPGCELTFVFFRRAGITDAEFASAIEWVTTDFMALQGLLEI